MNRLTGKTAVVVGAATGLGAACVRAFAREGARAVVVDRDEAAARSVSESITDEGGTATAMYADLGDDTSVRSAIARIVEENGGIDVLHLNAADTKSISEESMIKIGDVTDDMWNAILRVNPTGFFFACRAAIPDMVHRGGGSIIMTSSCGAIRSEMSRSTYGLSKAAVSGLMRSVATQYGRDGIRCNAILPGAILTPEYRDGPRQWPENVVRNHQRHGLLSRIGNENDIANAAVFLACDESAYITGHELVVDGGLTVHMPHMADEVDIVKELAALYPFDGDR